MSVSTDAQLYYGIQLTEEIELPWEAYEFDDWYLSEIMGLDVENMEYEDKKEAYDKCLIDCIVHCHENSPMYALCVKGTDLLAYRGYPTEVDIAELSKHVTQDAVAELKRIADMVDPEHGEPAWWISSYWG